MTDSAALSEAANRDRPFSPHHGHLWNAENGISSQPQCGTHTCFPDRNRPVADGVKMLSVR